MNAFQRAFAYVRRRLVKTILLIVTFFLIGNLVILGLGISQAAENAKILTRKSMRAVVSYEVDYNAYWKYTDSITDLDELEEAYRNYPRISSDVALSLTNDERVKAFNYMVTGVGYFNEIDHVPVGNESQKGTSSYIDENGNETEYREQDVMIYANMYPSMIEVEEGTFTVTDGRFYSQSDIDNANRVVLITEELAEQNSLRVGDTISLTILDQYYETQLANANISKDETLLELEIIGIYHTINDVNPAADNFNWMSPYESPKNIVLMPMSTYTEYSYEIQMIQFRVNAEWNVGVSEDEYAESIRQEINTPTKVVYLLDDPLNVDAFVEDNTPNLTEYTILNANNDTFKKMARPLDTLNFFANILVWIVVINAIVIITLVTALTLKTREYEIGVLLSIGVSKVKVVVQLFIELFMIALLGFTLATVSGSMLAGRVGDAVLNYQTSTDAQYEGDDDSYYWSNSTDYFTEVTQEQMLQQYKVEVSPLLILEIYALGTLVVLIAIVIPSFMIMRLNPKQILLEQN